MNRVTELAVGRDLQIRPGERAPSLVVVLERDSKHNIVVGWLVSNQLIFAKIVIIPKRRL